MLYPDERKLIVEYGKKLLSSGLTKGTGGNLSIFKRDDDVVLISPSGLEYTQTRPEDVVLTNLRGEVIEGTRKPSSEFPMHVVFYRERTDIDAIVHTHSPFCTTLSVLGRGMPAHHYLVALAGGDVRCSEYETFGTEELAQTAFDAMRERYAVILKNHGMMAGASSLNKAFYIAEEMELMAEVYWRACCIGEPMLLAEEEIRKVASGMKTYVRE
jgi:L-fuculose-phosphate aldolase